QSGQHPARDLDRHILVPAAFLSLGASCWRQRRKSSNVAIRSGAAETRPSRLWIGAAIRLHSTCGPGRHADPPGGTGSRPTWGRPDTVAESMQNVFDIYTIIFLALAVFIFLRLRSVLGQRTGRERPPYDPYSAREPGRPATEKVVALPPRPAAAEPIAVPQS